MDDINDSNLREQTEKIQKGNKDVISLTILLKNAISLNMMNFNPFADNECENVNFFIEECIELAENIKTDLKNPDGFVNKPNKFNENIMEILIKSLVQLLINFCNIVNDYTKNQLFIQMTRRVKVRFIKNDGSSVSDHEAHDIVEQLIQDGKKIDESFVPDKSFLAQLHEVRSIILCMDHEVKYISQITNDLLCMII